MTMRYLTSESELPTASKHVLWKGSILETSIKFGGGLSLDQLDREIAKLQNTCNLPKADFASATYKEISFLAALKKDRNRFGVNGKR